MQKVLVFVTAAVIILTCETSHASKRVRATGNQQSTVSTAPSQPRPFSRVMELERRKNAALREMFFGR